MAWSDAARAAAAEARKRHTVKFGNPLNNWDRVGGKWVSTVRSTAKKAKKLSSFGMPLRGDMTANNLSYKDRIYRARMKLLRSK